MNKADLGFFSKLNRLVNQIQKKDIKVVVARNDLTTL
jgi:hypothetical protein